MGRQRATSDEWRQYYERAERARARSGDPFQRLIAREVRRARIFNVVATAVALAAAAGSIRLLLSLLESASP